MSACLSHSGIVSKRRKLLSRFLQLSESPNILVLNIRFIPKFDRGHPGESDVWEWGGYELAILAIFRQIVIHRISKTVQEWTRLLICYWSLIGNCIRAFDWYQNQRLWMTLNWPWRAIVRFVALHICLSEPTAKIWMKIDPYYQRRKCSPGIAVSSKIRFMRILGGVDVDPSQAER